MPGTARHVVKPFFATPYPGSEWFYVYKDRILEQYGGDLEAFMLDLGDATRSPRSSRTTSTRSSCSALRELMVQRDLRRIAAYEEEWNRHHPEGPWLAAKAPEPAGMQVVTR